jgi:hypothetical protein
MTRQLRQRHRRVVLALALIVPGLFIAALTARRTVPVNPAPQFDSTGGTRTNQIAH